MVCSLPGWPHRVFRQYFTRTPLHWLRPISFHSYRFCDAKHSVTHSLRATQLELDVMSFPCSSVSQARPRQYSHFASHYTLRKHKPIFSRLDNAPVPHLTMGLGNYSGGREPHNRNRMPERAGGGELFSLVFSEPETTLESNPFRIWQDISDMPSGVLSLRSPPGWK